MRNKTLIVLLILIVTFGVEFISSPQATHAQESPTMIYGTDYETEPISPGNYGGAASALGEQWGSTCGVDDSACIYNDYNFFYSPENRAAAAITYTEHASDTEVEVEDTWAEACVINFRSEERRVGN